MVPCQTPHLVEAGGSPRPLPSQCQRTPDPRKAQAKDRLGRGGDVTCARVCVASGSALRYCVGAGICHFAPEPVGETAHPCPFLYVHVHVVTCCEPSQFSGHPPGRGITVPCLEVKVAQAEWLGADRFCHAPGRTPQPSLEAQPRWWLDPVLGSQRKTPSQPFGSVNSFIGCFPKTGNHP